jgi:hypothetical protein
MQLITSLAVLATAVGSVQALGNAIIYNKCSYDVYMWATDASRNPSSPVTIPSGGSYSEGYHTPASGGVSLKISKTTSDIKITQFEYTVQPYDGTNFVWYDGSNVNCQGTDCPFYYEGMYLETSLSSCPTRTCPAGAATCTGFYTLYNDDVNSLSCDDSADTILYLCATSAITAPIASVVAAVSNAVAAVLPAPSSTYVAPSSVSTTAKPSTTSSAKVYINEAVVTTFVTVTKGHTHSKRAEVHAHARHHQN